MADNEHPQNRDITPNPAAPVDPHPEPPAVSNQGPPATPHSEPPAVTNQGPPAVHYPGPPATSHPGPPATSHPGPLAAPHPAPPATAPHPGPPVDPDQYAQFQQFQQFQQFLKYQESQGDVPQLPAAKKPTWKKIVFSKAFRRAAFYLVVIIAVIWAYNHYFGTPDDDGKGTQGTAGPGQKTDPGKASTSPNAAIDTLYRWAATGNQGTNAASACQQLFNEAGQRAFVIDFGGPDCESVVRGLAGKVGVLLRPPIIDTYNKQVIEISSCDDLALKPDTQGLGKFVFTRFGDGWIISGHQPEPNPCPTPPPSSTGSPSSTTSSSPTTSTSR